MKKLGLTAATSAADARIHKNILSSEKTTLIISNKEMEDIMKILKFLENFALLEKSASETTENETKEQKGRFLGLLLSTLSTS